MTAYFSKYTQFLRVKGLPNMNNRCTAINTLTPLSTLKFWHFLSHSASILHMNLFLNSIFSFPAPCYITCSSSFCHISTFIPTNCFLYHSSKRPMTKLMGPFFQLFFPAFENVYDGSTVSTRHGMSHHHKILCLLPFDNA